MQSFRPWPCLRAVMTWLLVLLFAEPHPKVLAQQAGPYQRALERLAAPAARNPTEAPIPPKPAPAETNLHLQLTRTPIMLTNGQQLLALSFFSDSNHNYVVEFRRDLGQDLCNDWQPLANAPHNYGIVFATNQFTNAFYRLRRIDVPRSPLFALLANDTGTNSHDGLTSDPTITGMALQFPAGTELRAALDRANGPFVTVTNLGAPRHFLLTREQLNGINGGVLPDGPHTLFLRAGNAEFYLPFVLDTTPPEIRVALDPAFDSAPTGDGRTTFNPVTLNGKVEPGARAELVSNGAAISANSNGVFSLTNVVLAQGTNRFVFRALDAACNEANVEARVVWLGSDCTFPGSLAGWQVDISDFGFRISDLPNPVPGSVTADRAHPCAALMTEGDSFRVALSREIVIPTLPAALTFDYAVTFDGATTNAMRDAFEAALVDASGRPLALTIQGPAGITPASAVAPSVLPPSPDAYFNHSDSRSPFAAPGSTIQAFNNSTTVSVDVRHLTPGSTARLIFRLVNNDRDRATTARVSDVVFRPLDAGTTLPGSPGTALSLVQADAAVRAAGACVNNVSFAGVAAAAGNSSVIVIDAPRPSAQLAPGLQLIAGRVPSGATLSVNGRPADAVDAAGNFFALVEVRAGVNEFTLVANAPTGAATNRLTVRGETCPTEFASLGTVTESVRPEYGRTTFHEATRVLYADLALRNAGAYAVRPPLYVGVTRISDPSVRLLGADGASADGIPYYDFSGAITNYELRFTSEAVATLTAQQSTLHRAFAFHNPNHAQFTYELAILARLNQPPMFTTAPVIEVVAGRDYAYDAEAVDPDGDAVTYTLLESPPGLTLNAANGLIAWPAANPPGSYRVRLQADDRRGGLAEQSFVLNVIVAPSNRPPVFVSTPITAARLGTNYFYNADAVDPDGDTLAYTLITAPTNLTIQASNGEIRWTPVADQLGTNRVVIEVNDGRGGVARQDYLVIVLADPRNRPPVITSVPVRTFEFSDLAPSLGPVAPSLLDLVLADGEAFAGAAAFTLPATNVLAGAADIAFVVDESGSMAGEQAWIGTMVEGLDAALRARGIGPNRYALLGFGGSDVRQGGHVFPISGGTWTASVYGPDNTLVGSRQFQAVPAPLDLALPRTGAYRVVISGNGMPEPMSYSLQLRAYTNAPLPLPLGQTVAGVLASEGQQNFYAFNLSRRSLLYLDSLTNSTLTWTLAGPAGTNVNARAFDATDASDQNTVVFDVPAGDYQLIVDGPGTQVGGYAFRLWNLADAAPLTPGTPVSGRIEPPGATALHRFNAAEGQRVFVNSLELSAGATSPRWRLVNPLGQTMDDDTLGRDLESAPLRIGGEYTLLLETRVRETNSRNYTLQVELHDDPVRALTVGTRVDGVIARAGEQIIYTFALPERTALYFDSFTASNNLTWTVAGPAGTNVNARTFNQSDGNAVDAPVLDLVAGDYRLFVDGTGDATGPFGFRLLYLTNAAPLTLNTVVADRLDPGNATELYAFNATAGDRVRFDSIARTNIPNSRWRLLGPYGGVFFAASLATDGAVTTLSQSGRYTLLIEGGVTDNVAGDYRFNIIPTNSVALPPLTGEPLTFGTTVAGSIDATNEIDAFRFTLAERAFVYFDALTNRSTLVWTLRGPAGTNVNARRFDQTDSADSAAPLLDLVAGEYEVDIDATGTNVGAYRFRLNALTNATPLTPATVVSGELSPGTETDTFTFNVAAGARVYADSISVSGGATSSRWRLFNPLGQIVGDAVLNQDLATGTLRVGGAYTLLLEGRASETNSRNYSFQVEVLTDSEQSLALGTRVETSIGAAGERDTYGFTLSERALLYFDALTNSARLTWTLTGPSGTVVDARRFDQSDSAANTNPVLEVPAGRYRLTVDAATNVVAPYGFRLLNLADATPLTPGTAVTGDLNPPTETDAYRFDVAANQRVFAELRAFSGGTTLSRWRLINPLGQIVVDQNLSREWETLPLSLGGRYTLLLEGHIAETNSRDYQFNIELLTDRPAPMTLGNVVAGMIRPSGARDVYAFTLPERTLVYFDSLTHRSTLTWTLESDAALLVNVRRFDQSDSADQANPILTLPAGTYRLTVAGTGTNTGDYRFRLAALRDAVAFTPGVTTSGELNPGSETDFFRFTAAAGMRVFGDARTLSGGATSSRWRLINPAGATVADATLGVDFEAGPLREGGEYTLLVEGRGTETNSRTYSFNLETFVDAGGALALGARVAGTLNAPGARELFNFTLTERSLLYFDSLVNTNAFTWTLDGPAGTNVAARRFDQSDAGDVTNPVLDLVAGDYRLSVDANADATGDFAFRLLNSADATPLTPGTVVRGTLNPGNTTALYRFDVTAGDRFFFDAISRTNLPNARWRLVNPFGVVIFHNPLNSDAPTNTLFQSGRYTLLIEGSRLDLAAGEFAFNVVPAGSVTLPPLTGAPLTLGQIVEGSLDATNQIDHYRFTLAANALAYFDALTHRNTLVWTLRGPTGTNVNARRFDQSDSADNATPVLELVAGDYELAVDATGTNTGAYRFRFFNLADAPLISSGMPTTGQLDPPNSTTILRFNAIAGMRVFADSRTLSGGTTSSRWRVINPLGQIVGDQVLSTDIETSPLRVGGDYTLLLEGRGTETTNRNYTILLALHADTPQPLTLDSLVQASLQQPGERDLYTFSLGDATTLYFDSLTNTANVMWSLEGPGGTVVNARAFNAGDMANPLFTLNLPRGQYRLTVEAAGDITSAYAFRLLTARDCPFVDGAAQKQGDLAAGYQNDVFTIRGLAGQRLYLDLGPGLQFGSAIQLAGTTDLLTTGGGFEDGYHGVNAALTQLPFRPEAAANVILVTDENRDVLDPALTLNVVLTEAAARSTRLNTILDGRINDALGNAAIGLDARSNSYVADGVGGFIVRSNGVFVGPADNDDAPENPFVEYVPLAWQTGGATWDLNQLRSGGSNAVSFTKAFVAINVEGIERQLRLNLVTSDRSVVFTNFTGILDGIGGGDTATFNYRLVRTGDARSFLLQFARPGTTDVIGAIPVRWRNEYTYALSALDPDGDSLRFALVRGPAGATLDPVTGLLRWRANAGDATRFIVRVEDGRGGIDFQEFTVDPSGTNRPPQITSPPARLATVDRVYTFRVTASDPDGDRLYFETTNAPVGLTLDRDSGVLRWRPSAAQLGRHAIALSVRDGRGGMDTQTYEVEVAANRLNVGPVFVSVPLADAVAGNAYVYAARAWDTNADELTFDLPLGPAGLTVSSNGFVIWTPTLDQLGGNDVVLRVQDGQGGVALQPFQINVVAENSPPVITTEPALTSVVGATYHYEIRAQDTEGDELAFFLGTNAPVGMQLVRVPNSINVNATLLTWTPSASQIGSNAVELIVRDEAGAEARQTFVVNVVSTAPNTPPRFVSTPRTQARLGAGYAYLAAAADADHDALTITLVTGPVGMAFTDSPLSSSTARMLLWTPQAGQFGSNFVHLHVTDGRGGSDDQRFAIVVGSTLNNEAPRIVSTPPLSATLDELYAYDPRATDPDGDPLAWRLVSGPMGMSLDPATGTLRWTPALDQLGANTVVLEVQDAYLATDQQEFVIDVGLANRPPRITSTPPTQATTAEPYVYAARASDSDGDALTWALVAGAFPAGMSIDATSGLIRWTPATNQVGAHQVAVRVADSRGGSDTQSFTLHASSLRANRAPVIVSTPPRGATVGRPFSYLLRATDADNDTLTLQLAQGPTGAVLTPQAGQPNQALLTWTPATGDAGLHEFILTARDPAGAMASQRFLVSVRENQPPQITSAPRTNGVPNISYSYDVTAFDPENDALRFQLTGPLGMSIDAAGRVSWLPTLAQIGNFPVTITVADAFGAAAMQSFAVNVGADTEPPVVALNVAFNIVDSSGNRYVRARSETAVQVSASDNVGVAARELLVAGMPVALSVDGSASVPFPESGVIEAIATARDFSGNTASVTNRIPVADPDATNTITIVIHSPTNGVEITRPTEVRATITSQRAPLSEYRLEFAEAAGGETSVGDPRLSYQSITNALFAPGVMGVTNVSLGRFDPTMLLNGGYFLRVTAFDVNRQGRQEGVLVSVAGNLKFGEFRLEFTDLRIPVAGIPITVKRVYDSRESRRQGDFGYGWCLALQDARILEVGKKPFVGLSLGEFTFTTATRVYMTTLDGRRVGFAFAPELDRVALVFGAFYRPAFKADPGVYDRLQPIGATGGWQIRGDGSFVGGFGLVGYDPEGYRLTTRQNVVYEYDQNFGLKSMADPNGNRIIYTRDGIFSVQAGVTNLGQSVRFVRDARGRVAQIVDPAGNSLRYTYDAAGDLSSFADQATNTTQYAYHSARPHYLERIMDPLERPVARTEYDNAGRAVGSVDALGNTLRDTFDADALVGTYTDALTNTMRIYYDPRGNVRQVVNALGVTNTYAYDANDNLISATMPCSCGSGSSTLSWNYDERGNLASVTDAQTNITRFRYNAQNKRTEVSDALGRRVRYQYDASGNLTNIVDPLGASSSIAYDSKGRHIRMTDANGNTTAFEYESASLPTRVIYPDGASRRLTYNHFGAVTRLVDELNRQLDLEYDVMGRLRRLHEPDGAETRYEYNGSQLAQVRDPLNRVTHYGYDATGRRVAETNALGHVTQYFYNGNQQLVATINARGYGTTNEYRADGKLGAIVNALGHRTTYTYDEMGNPTANVDALGRVHRSEYDARGKLIRRVHPDGVVEQFEYDAVGNRTAHIDANGHRRQFVYDALNRTVADIDPLGGVTRHGFDAAGNRVEVTDALGRTTRSIFDLRRRLQQVMDPAGGVLAYGYDASSQRTAITNALGRVTRLSYDRVSRLVGAIDPAGGVNGNAFDAAGNLVATTNEVGSVTRHAYDELNRRISTTDPNGGITRFAYDEVGNRVQVVDAVNNTNRFVYDPLNRLIEEIDPAGHRRIFEYDAQGNRTMAVDRNQRRRTFAYDLRDRLVAEVWWNGATPIRTNSHAYDPVGNVLALSDSATRYTHTYDAANRLVSVDNAGPLGVPRLVLTFTNDAVGNPLSISDNRGTLMTSLFDGRDRILRRLWQGSDIAPGRMDFEYDVAGNGARQDYFADLAGTQLASRSTYTRDLLGRVAQLVHRNGAGQMLADYRYAYNAASQTTQEVYQAEASALGYDAAGQLTSVQRSDGSSENYRYDLNGSRVNDSSTVGRNNQILSDGTHTFVYDNEGNLIRRTETATGRWTDFRFDHLNRIDRVEQRDAGGALTNLIEYVYDVQGRRIARKLNGTATFSTYHGEQVWADFDDAGRLQARYAHGDRMDQILARHTPDGARLAYLGDKLGSVRDAVSADGATIGQARYDSFGQPRARTGALSADRFAFTGREFDAESGLYHYRARSYAASLGRFVSLDPIGFSGGDHNLYRYVQNQPADMVDPTGLSTATESGIITTRIALPIAALRAPAMTVELVGASTVDAAPVAAALTPIRVVASSGPNLFPVTAAVGRILVGLAATLALYTTAAVVTETTTEVVRRVRVEAGPFTGEAETREKKCPDNLPPCIGPDSPCAQTDPFLAMQLPAINSRLPGIQSYAALTCVNLAPVLTPNPSTSDCMGGPSQTHHCSVVGITVNGRYEPIRGLEVSLPQCQCCDPATGRHGTYWGRPHWGGSSRNPPWNLPVR